MSAPRSPWELKDFHARLALGELEGEIDVRCPLTGMVASLGSEKLRLLRVELPPPKDKQADESPDCYVRGQDLVSTYLQDERRKIRGQLYWRALRCGPAADWPGLELIVSVQTSLLDSDPTLRVRSNVPAIDVLCLENLKKGTAKTMTRKKGRVASSRRRLPACWLFRLSDENRTYVEMVHPSDFVKSDFQEESPGDVEHSTKLFRGPLEKGVILRSRLRGVVVPRGADIVAAVECYQEFAASEPPLTT
jgi:hypothetical protein